MIPAFDPGPNPFGRPPVYVGGFGPRMVEVAGEVADGLITHPFTTRQSLEQITLPALDAGLAASGRTRADVQVVCATLVVTAEREEELERLKRRRRGEQLAFYGSTPAYAPTLECHGWGDLHPELNRLSKEGRWDEMAGADRRRGARGRSRWWATGDDRGASCGRGSTASPTRSASPTTARPTPTTGPAWWRSSRRRGEPGLEQRRGPCAHATGTSSYVPGRLGTDRRDPVEEHARTRPAPRAGRGSRPGTRADRRRTRRGRGGRAGRAGTRAGRRTPISSRFADRMPNATLSPGLSCSPCSSCVLHAVAEQEADRRVVAQRLLDRGRDQRPVGAQRA